MVLFLKIDNCTHAQGAQDNPICMEIDGGDSARKFLLPVQFIRDAYAFGINNLEFY